MLTLFPEKNKTTAADQALLEAIWRVPRPRPLRASWSLYAAALGGAFFIAIGFQFLKQNWNAYWTPRGHVSVYLMGFMIVWCAFLIVGVVRETSRLLRDRELLSNGEDALAKIVDVTLTHSGRHSRNKIHYTFRDSAGREATGTAIDVTREMQVGEHTPVFFDAQDSENKNVPLNSSIWKIVFPPGGAA